MLTMKETISEYVKRIEGKVAGQNPIKVQAATAQKLARLVKGATPAKLKKRPAPEKWSAAEIIAHLADVEIAVGWRIRSILGAPGTALQAYDQDAWAMAGQYFKRGPREAVGQVRGLPGTNFALLKIVA